MLCRSFRTCSYDKMINEKEEKNHTILVHFLLIAMILFFVVVVAIFFYFNSNLFSSLRNPQSEHFTCSAFDWTFPLQKMRKPNQDSYCMYSSVCLIVEGKQQLHYFISMKNIIQLLYVLLFYSFVQFFNCIK